MVILSIELDQHSFAAGAQLKGRVKMGVVGVVGVMKTGSRLELRIEGAERTAVRAQHGFGSGNTKMMETHNNTRMILQIYVCLAKFDDVSVPAPGWHVYPFSLALPFGLPASFNFPFPDSESNCSLRYTAVAALWEEGSDWGASGGHLSDECNICIDATHIPTVPVPTILKPRTDKIYYAYCCKSGVIQSGGSVSTNTASNGDKIKVNVAIENQSSSRITSAELSLVQTVTWSADNHSYERRFILASKSLTIDEGDTYKPVHKGGQVGQNDILLRLTDKNGKRTSWCEDLEVAKATGSYTGALITVSHMISVKLCTSASADVLDHQCQLLVQVPPSSPSPSSERVVDPASNMEVSAPAYVSTFPPPPPTVDKTNEVGPEKELLEQLDTSLPLLALAIVTEWFANHTEIKSLSPTSLANIFVHVHDPASKIRVAYFLSSRLEQLSTGHLRSVAFYTRPVNEADANCTGTRWSVLKAMASKVTDRDEFELLVQTLDASADLVKLLFEQ